jgi:hypothetical protein
VQAGHYDVIVGTRPSVFAPVPDLGLIVVARESHPALREDRAPYYHARDVALARGAIDGTVVVLAAMAPSSEAAALALPSVAPRRRTWVPVEIVPPGPEGRAPRLVKALGHTSRGRGRLPRLRPARGVLGLRRSAPVERRPGRVRGV